MLTKLKGDFKKYIFILSNETFTEFNNFLKSFTNHSFTKFYKQVCKIIFYNIFVNHIF